MLFSPYNNRWYLFNKCIYFYRLLFGVTVIDNRLVTGTCILRYVLSSYRDYERCHQEG